MSYVDIKYHLMVLHQVSNMFRTPITFGSQIHRSGNTTGGRYTVVKGWTRHESS